MPYQLPHDVLIGIVLWSLILGMVWGCNDLTHGDDDEYTLRDYRPTD